MAVVIHGLRDGADTQDRGALLRSTESRSFRESPSSSTTRRAANPLGAEGRNPVRTRASTLHPPGDGVEGTAEVLGAVAQLRSASGRCKRAAVAGRHPEFHTGHCKTAGANDETWTVAGVPADTVPGPPPPGGPWPAPHLVPGRDQQDDEHARNQRHRRVSTRQGHPPCPRHATRRGGTGSLGQGK